MNEVWIEAPVCEVTLFEDRARVRRRATVKLSQGSLVLGIADVSPVLSDKSLNAAFMDNKDMNPGLSVRREMTSDDEHEDKIRKVEESIKDLEEQSITQSDLLQSVENRTANLKRILEISFSEIPADIAGGRLLGDDRKLSLEDLDRQLSSLSLEKVGIECRIEELNESLEDLRNQHEILKTPSVKYVASVLIETHVPSGGRYELVVDYLVPCACWRPRHRATLDEGLLQMETEAVVWQNSGEDWKDVKLSFSTHRPSLGLTPPVLCDDRISIVRKAKEDVIEFRDEEISDAGFGSSGDNPAAAAQSLPGIDDGGLARNFEAEYPADIPSDGRPYSVSLGVFKGEAETDIISMPELSPYAFIRSLQTNQASYPLLAGPVSLVRNGSCVGRSSITYTAEGERFPLSWGTQADIRLYRTVSTKTRDGGPLNPWSRKDHFIELKLGNLGGEPRELIVKERIPVSELEKVRISFDKETASDGFRGPDENGFIEWPVVLPPGARKILKMAYTIEKRKTVVENL